MPGFIHDQLPSRVVFGAGVSRTALTSEVERLGATRALVLASTRDEDRVAALTSPLGDRVTGVFTAVREHVPLLTAEAARAAAKEADADVLIAIGGGSTIGAAKAVALTARLPIVAVPTTYAGSEVTPVWGLTENGRKTTGTDPAVLPRVVVYDPELVATPAARPGRDQRVQRAGARGGGDVGAPPQPRGHRDRRRGDRRLAAGLRTRDPAELLCGAWLAASAFAAAGSGLHHKLCHVLGGTFDLPHAAHPRGRTAARAGVQRAGRTGGGRAGRPRARHGRRPRRAPRSRRGARHPPRAAGARDARRRDREGRCAHRSRRPARQPGSGRRRSDAGAGARGVDRRILTASRRNRVPLVT